MSIDESYESNTLWPSLIVLAPFFFFYGFFLIFENVPVLPGDKYYLALGITPGSVREVASKKYSVTTNVIENTKSSNHV